jgi:hypothetical protein
LSALFIIIIMTKASSGATKQKATKEGSCTKEQLFGVIAKLSLLHDGKPPRDLVARHAGYGNGSNASLKKALSRASKENQMDTSERCGLAHP